MSSDAGLSIYMSRLYSQMPWEDFKYMAQWGLPRRSSWLGCFGVEGTGEAVNRDGLTTPFRGEDDPWWGAAYTLIRDANKLIEGLPAYRDNYANEAVYNDYIGQAYFVRAYSYYQMARRYGGVPLVTEVIEYPATSDKLERYRASEEDTWNQILADFDMAAELMMPESKLRGYANKYVALAFKAEAMLYAGSVAKYNSTVTGNLTGIGAKSGNRVMGFGDNAAELSQKWFTEAYKAAREVMTEGGYSLYKKTWAEGDKEAQYRNMVDMWSDLTSPENILVREYEYPTLCHGLDAYSSPFLWHSPLAGGTCPTLDFIEMFDGLEYHPDGTLKLTTGSSNDKGEYLLYDSPMDLFAQVEPRLRAYVILPMDEFRKETIEVRAGIFTGGSQGHVPLLFGDNYSYGAAQTKYADSPYYNGSNKSLYLGAQPTSGIETVSVNGKEMPATGACGVWQEYYESTLTGLHLRKYLDENKVIENIGEGKSDQPFILMRYADVLLAAASNAIIVGFQVRPSAAARKAAEKEQIDIRLYSIIYDAINEIKDAIEGMLEPVMKEEIVCSTEVMETFKISKVGTVAGCIVREGKMQRNTAIRVIRDGIVIYTGKLGSLRRFKDDVKEVTMGQDCGLNIESYNDIKVGDIIEGYEQVEVKRK